MLTSEKRLQKAYTNLVRNEGEKASPREFKKSIFIIMFQMMNLAVHSPDEITDSTGNAAYDLFLLYLFFDEMEEQE